MGIFLGSAAENFKEKLLVISNALGFKALFLNVSPSEYERVWSEITANFEFETQPLDKSVDKPKTFNATNQNETSLPNVTNIPSLNIPIVVFEQEPAKSEFIESGKFISEPTKIEKVKLDHIKLKSIKLDQIKIDPIKLELDKTEPTNLEPTNSELPKADLPELDLPELDLPKIEPAKSDSSKSVVNVPIHTALVEPKRVIQDFKNMASILAGLKTLMTMEGAQGCMLADYRTGELIAKEGGDDIDFNIIALGNGELIKSLLKVMADLNIDDLIEDIFITLGKQYHLIRPVAAKSGLFLYIILNKSKANLALARLKLLEVEKKIEI